MVLVDTGTRGVTFDRCRFNNAGNVALGLNGAQNVTVTRSTVIGAGGTGIQSSLCTNVTLNNSYVRGYGAVFPSASGVVVTCAPSHTEVN